MNQIQDQYDVNAMAINADQLQTDDVVNMMEKILASFPVTQVAFHLPKWVEMLPLDHWLKQELLDKVRVLLDHIAKISDVSRDKMQVDSDTIREFRIDKIGMEDGKVKVSALFDDSQYYQILSELVGTPIAGEYQLIHLLKEYTSQKEQIGKIGSAWQEVHQQGYGVITPTTQDIKIEEPQLIHHGNKYGVKLKAVSPSIHLIQADIETEIAPIVGSEEQAKDLIDYIAAQGKEKEGGIWETNIFGKTVQQLVEEGMNNKVNRLTQESQ